MIALLYLQGAMRRLYSPFSSGLPGAGLLIMRLVTSAVLLARGFEGLGGALIESPAEHVAGIALGILIIAGLWTPVAGVLVAVVEIGSFIARAGDPWVHLLLTTLGISLSLLGPGAWSVDSRLFGWRRIDIDTRDKRSRQ